MTEKEVMHSFQTHRQFGGKKYRFHSSSRDRDQLKGQGEFMKNNNQIMKYRTVKTIAGGEFMYLLYIR